MIILFNNLVNHIEGNFQTTISGQNYISMYIFYLCLGVGAGLVTMICLYQLVKRNFYAIRNNLSKIDAMVDQNTPSLSPLWVKHVLKSYENTKNPTGLKQHP